MPLYRNQASAYGDSLLQAADAAAARALLDPFPRNLFHSFIPFVLPSSGSMANNGAITLTVALFQILPQAYIYLPANAIVAGSAAGWYYVTFSSTTVGQVFNNTYDPTVGGVPTVPSSPTTFVTTGPGAYTASTAAQQGPTYNMPANTLGVNGKLRIEAKVRVPTVATSKSFNVRAGASALFPGAVLLNNGTGAALTGRVEARGATNKQNTSVAGFATGVTLVSPFQLTLDMTAAQAVNAQMTIPAAATDYIVLLGFEVVQDA